MIKFGFIKEVEGRYSKKRFESLVKKFYEVLSKRVDKMLFERDGLVDLVLIDDEKMVVMNKEYRGKEGTTDVISFAYLEVTEYEKEDGDVVAGDIFISVDKAKKQAKEKGHSLAKELDILFVHGMLHLFGFDHETDDEEEEMEGWAEKVLN